MMAVCFIIGNVNIDHLVKHLALSSKNPVFCGFPLAALTKTSLISWDKSLHAVPLTLFLAKSHSSFRSQLEGHFLREAIPDAFVTVFIVKSVIQ